MTMIKLEQQLETLAKLGLSLNDGITLDDLLYSFDRIEYEEKPYDLIMFIFGVEVEREPWGRPFCSRAWQLDMECIDFIEDYKPIIERLCEVANLKGVISEIQTETTPESDHGILKYKADGQEKSLKVTIKGDWADPKTIAQIMKDIERDGKRFYAKDNGQSSIWFYLDKPTADELNKLTNNALVLGP